MASKEPTIGLGTQFRLPAKRLDHRGDNVVLADQITQPTVVRNEPRDR